ncbi:type IV methyl-directed restriction system, component McrB [Campylobacter sp. RM5004]|uniref:McrB family protein n=1 Tax=Campylobacter sp. RM5004 TaxID=1660078 RepID=UPI001EFAACD8|nr:AAA family ATPase [Campylobacter sp. RM5004]ULO00747.1 type IV methyl-directed restriction system, component McrB [Campylobacter sp. RM5004]
MPISFTDNERKEFQSGINAFISEINKCLKNKNKSTKGFSVNNIKPFFNFFENSYEYSIGSGSGTLADTCWIIFVRKELLSDELINTSKVSPRYGVYVYFGYSHSLKEGFKYRLAFGFPKHDIENARCKAVDEMERSGKLTELDFTYDKLDLEQITDDFIKLLEYYESFSKDDFIPKNPKNNDDFYEWLSKNARQDNGEFYSDESKKNESSKTNTLKTLIKNKSLKDLANYIKSDDFISIQDSRKGRDFVYTARIYADYLNEKYYKQNKAPSEEEQEQRFAFWLEVRLRDSKDYLKLIDDFKSSFLAKYQRNIFSILELNELINIIGKNTYNDYIASKSDAKRTMKEFIRFLIKDYSSDAKNIFLQDEPKQNPKNIPLNQILYGAPGVGKTYNTINIALEILGEDFSTQTNEIYTRKAMQERFKDYVKNGQIVFTTFHQSYGYEEFVEGIRPDFDNDELRYVIADGVFKDLCKKAKQNYINYSTPNELDFDKLINYFAEYVKSEFLDQNKEFLLEKGVNIHSIFYDKDGECRSFELGGTTQSGQRLTLDIIKRDYEEFKIGNIKSYKDIKPKFESKSIHHGNAGYYFMLYKKLFEFEKKDDYKNQKEDLKPYIIIIDEINRGNISKIFGELITLIEPSKRLGNAEELEVVLPYSKERFSVPNNVYIIGTMNTADRSITTLDTALRRRFEFKKIMPDSSLLKFKLDEIELDKLLDKMNERIECLIGDEKLIGHSYFMDINSIDELKAVFSKKILPLLEEYFYNDYSQIKSVLNDNSMIKTKNILNTDTLYLSDDFSEVDFKKIYED